MSNEAVPEPWASRLIEKGYTDGRYAHDVPSLSKLAGDIGVHTSTVSNAISGKRRAKADTVRRLAEVLGDDVAVWLGTEHAGPWQPPPAPGAAAATRLAEVFTARPGGGDAHVVGAGWLA